MKSILLYRMLSHKTDTNWSVMINKNTCIDSQYFYRLFCIYRHVCIYIDIYALCHFLSPIFCLENMLPCYLKFLCVKNNRWLRKL